MGAKMSSAALIPVDGTVLDRPSTPEQVAAAWLLGYTGSTREAYARDLRKWGDWLAGLGVDPFHARRAHVDAYARWLEAEGRAPATVARALAALSSFYSYAVAEEVTSHDPVARSRRPRVEAPPTLGLSGEEVSRLLDDSRANHRDHALMCLLALNGLRISEVLGANVEDLGHERGHRTLAVVRKGGKRALVPLAPRTAEAVDAYLVLEHVGSKDPVFVTTSGRRLDRHAAWKIVRRLARQARIEKDISPHSLRHSFVTLALDAGASLRDVQDAAGHADPRTTRRYDRARFSLDRHPTYAVAAEVA